MSAPAQSTACCAPTRQAGAAAVTIAVEALAVSYGGVPAIRNAALEVATGTLAALVGPSGCGKTTLLHAINGLLLSHPDCTVSGSVRVAGMQVLAAGTDLLALRRRVGLVFQQPNPFPLSVAGNIEFPLKEHGVPRARRRARTEQVLREVGLWDEVRDRLDRPATGLSGGQQQRLCIARALALEPEVLLLDEPCSALDPMAAQTVENLIGSLKGRYTLLMVTHNLAQARRLADQITVCWSDGSCGCVIESGTPAQIFTDARHPLTRAYCGGETG